MIPHRPKRTVYPHAKTMAVIVICLAPAVHPIAADVILTALAVWTMRNGR